jgi:hypothetical protein
LILLCFDGTNNDGNKIEKFINLRLALFKFYPKILAESRFVKSAPDLQRDETFDR